MSAATKRSETAMTNLDSILEEVHDHCCVLLLYSVCSHCVCSIVLECVFYSCRVCVVTVCSIVVECVVTVCVHVCSHCMFSCDGVYVCVIV